MRILLDTNVLITYITQREDPYTEESKRLVEMCSNGSAVGFMAFHSLSVIWYTIGKMKGASVARRWLEELCQVIQVSAASHEQILAAVKNVSFKDFEDCLVDICAADAQVDYVVTANIRDFANSSVPAVKPDDFFALVGSDNDNV